MDIFRTLGFEIALSHRHVEKRVFSRLKRIQQYTASKRTTRRLISYQMYKFNKQTMSHVGVNSCQTDSATA